MKTLAEQLEALRSTRAQHEKTMQDVAQKSIDEGRSMNTAEAEQFDEAETAIKTLDADIDRLTRLQASQAKSAKPVASIVPDSKGNPLSYRVQTSEPKLEPGIAFARAAKCLALSHLEHKNAVEIAKNLYGERGDIIATVHRLVTKAPVAPATTTDPTWAGPLVGEESSVFADFIEYLRPMTILGKFGNNGIPDLRRVPFRTRLIGQTTGGSGYWVGEGQAKPLTKFDFNGTTLLPLKVANIAVATMETVRDSNPAADVVIRDQLVAALQERLDIDFIDPDKVAVAGVSPASITNGAVAIPSTGTDQDAINADIRAVFGAFIAANNAPTSGVWIMSSTTALALALMLNPLGQPAYPGVTMNGGTLAGLPVITSEYVTADTAGSIVALVNARDIYLGDEGGFDVSMSTEASLQMDDAPDNPTTGATVLVSLWQRNLVGFRAERAINWSRRRPSAVAYLTGVNWG
jgi:HK97 family phage major capsid protein